MPSAAKDAFDRALVDVDNLLWFHEQFGGAGQGRRGGHFHALNKSGIVHLCAAWESYIEAVIVECANRNIDAAASPDQMLRSIQKITQKQIRDGVVENTWIGIAGTGWIELTKTFVRTRVETLNTPKAGPVTELMKAVLGINDIKSNWEWHRNPLGTPATKLDAFVTLRGAVAHGAQLEQSVTKANVTAALDLINRLVNCVEAELLRSGLLD